MLDDVLDALATARASVAEPDDFLLGLFRGRGWSAMAAAALTTGATRLRDDDRDALRAIFADMLEAAAPLAAESSDFDEFLRDHWGDLLSSAVGVLDRLGPKLLHGASPLLRTALLGAIKAAAALDPAAPPSPKIVAALMAASIDALASHPELSADGGREKWLAGLIKSVLGVVHEASSAATFSADAVERITLAAADSLAGSPELLAKQDTFSRILKAVLDAVGAMTGLRGDTAERLAIAMLGATLRGIADDPALADKQLGPLLADLLKGVTALVATRRLRDAQVVALATDVIDAMSLNANLFVKQERALVGAALGALVTATEGDEGKLLVGGTLVALARELVQVLASHGRLLGETVPADELSERLAALLAAGLARAESEIGRRMSRAELPGILAGLVVALARGELATLDADDANFKRIFASIADSAAT
jgi:hypothetical protein